MYYYLSYLHEKNLVICLLLPKFTKYTTGFPRLLIIIILNIFLFTGEKSGDWPAAAQIHQE